MEQWRWEFFRRRYSIRNLYAFRARDDFAQREGKIIDPYKAMWLPEYRQRALDYRRLMPLFMESARSLTRSIRSQPGCARLWRREP